MSIAILDATPGATSRATLERPCPEALAVKARALLGQGRLGAAQPVIAALRALGSARTLAAELEARLAFALGRVENAMAVLTAAIADEPGSTALLSTRAELRLLAGDPPGAAADAADAVVLDRRDAGAKALLGRALLQLGRFADAVACLDEALAARPGAVATRLDLAAALDALSSPELGEAVIVSGLALSPGNAALRSAAMLRRIRAGDFTAALAMAQSARHGGALDACGFGLMGHALSSLGRHAEAADAYVEALKLAPEDPYVRHLAAAAGRVAAGDRAPADYVRVLFDGYADRFDNHLIHLGYRVPGLLRALLRRDPPMDGPVLDLGCGTGLLALACRDVAPGDWVGVDLSPRMLEAARAKELYAELHEADLISYLAGEARDFPLIVAGDVLCYLGELRAPLRAVAPRLRPAGRFFCTAELLASPRDEVRLGHMGRYAHSRAHILAAAEAAGLTVVSVAEETLRLEGQAPVPGLLVLLERPAA